MIGAYVGQVETAKRGTYMAIAGGPILDWTNKDLREAIFADIKEQAEKDNCVFVRIRPQITETPETRTHVTCAWWRWIIIDQRARPCNRRSSRQIPS